MYNEEDGLFIDSSNNNDIVATFHSSNTTLSWHTEDDFSKGFVIANHSNTLTVGIINNNIIEPSIIMNSNTNIYKDIITINGIGNQHLKPNYIYTSNIYIENINLNATFLYIQQKIQQIIMNTVPLPPSIAPKPSEDLNIELVNVEKRYNLNDFFSGEVKSYNILSNPQTNIAFRFHLCLFILYRFKLQIHGVRIH